MYKYNEGKISNQAYIADISIFFEEVLEISFSYFLAEASDEDGGHIFSLLFVI